MKIQWRLWGEGNRWFTVWWKEICSFWLQGASQKSQMLIIPSIWGEALFMLRAYVIMCPLALIFLGLQLLFYLFIQMIFVNVVKVSPMTSATLQRLWKDTFMLTASFFRRSLRKHKNDLEVKYTDNAGWNKFTLSNLAFFHKLWVYVKMANW